MSGRASIVQAIALTLMLAALETGAARIQEDFSTDPLAHGWQIYGQNTLFHWNTTNQNLEVTWDSSQQNSYFHLPLGVTLDKNDDFSFEFNLVLNSIAFGVDPQHPYTFEFALGLLNLQSATSPSLERGSGINATHGPRNIVEFDYFPDSGYGATVSPTIISSNNQWATVFSLFTMDLGAVFHVAMSYTASNQTLTTTMTKNGEPFGPIDSVVLDGSFNDFQVDHFALESYNDTGADGSILATGIIDNIQINVPPPPVQNIAGHFTNGVWEVTFQSRTNWGYTLERTANLQSWTSASSLAPGTGELLQLQDPAPAAQSASYRVRAQRQ